MTTRRLGRLWPGAIVLVLAGACSDPATGTGEQPSRPVTLAPVTFDTWGEKLASYPPDIVVVDMWATWCVSCLERFPKMVELSHRYREHGVRFVSLNLDDHEDAQALAEALMLLKKFGAEFENYFMDENLMASFERLGLIGIPAVVIYDRAGREAYRLTGDNPNRQFTDADVEASIAALLAGSDAYRPRDL